MINITCKKCALVIRQGLKLSAKPTLSNKNNGLYCSLGKITIVIICCSAAAAVFHKFVKLFKTLSQTFSNFIIFAKKRNCDQVAY